MSKKNRTNFQFSSSSIPSASVGAELTEEYRIIRHDLIRVVVLNAVFLVGVLALYYTNRSSGYLERWFEKLF